MKKMKKVLIASMCVAAMGAVIVPVTGTIRSGKAEDTLTWDAIELASDYLRGDTITIPERDLSINGNAYDSVIKLTYPNGVTTAVASGEFNLVQPGQYTLIYEAKDENYKTYKENTGDNLQYLRLGSGFLAMTRKAKVIGKK